MLLLLLVLLVVRLFVCLFVTLPASRLVPPCTAHIVVSSIDVSSIQCTVYSVQLYKRVVTSIPPARGTVAHWYSRGVDCSAPRVQCEQADAVWQSGSGNGSLGQGTVGAGVVIGPKPLLLLLLWLWLWLFVAVEIVVGLLLMIADIWCMSYHVGIK